jgi:excinuclease UvrABC ATPase subunit
MRVRAHTHTNTHTHTHTHNVNEYIAVFALNISRKMLCWETSSFSFNTNQGSCAEHKGNLTSDLVPYTMNVQNSTEK